MAKVPEAVKTAIRETYRELDTPLDTLLSDPAKAEQFNERINRKLPPNLRLSVKESNSKALWLRKKGGARGGLPPLRGGHGPSPRN